MNDQTRPQALLPLIIADIYELAGRLREHGEDIASAVGQSQARWQVMSAASVGPCTVPQIARRLGVTRQSVQRIANALVAERWASFEPNPDHRSSPYLALNARGRATLADITNAAKTYNAALARKLTATDVKAIHAGLRRLLDATAE